MQDIEDNSIDLIITSPPYPMIEMWDEIMFKQNEDIRALFNKKKYMLAFELMHLELDKIWHECFRVLNDGGIACINIGDATRKLNNNFSLYSNHSRIIQGFLDCGYQNLPNIIWRKQTNAPNKFMGSGMLPPSAYVTLEHEYILIFRKGVKKEFKNKDELKNRYYSSYFWEERNKWFSDIWEIKGAKQKLFDKDTRDRSAAYPFDIPYRLINMFSSQNDTILDPFLGTGTTTLAAISAKRNSIGYEIDKCLNNSIKNNIVGSEDILNDIITKRLNEHLKFVDKRKSEKGEHVFKHENENYNFPVVTKQESKISIPFIKKITASGESFDVTYFSKIGVKAPNSPTLF
jgi:modification methylase